MNLKQLLWTSLLALTLAACGGGGGSPAAPPVGGIKYLNGDGQVTLSWQPTSGIYYWLWFVQGNDPGLRISDPGLGVNAPSGGNPNILPDYVMSPAANGYWFSYAVNAHAGNPTGPGGPQSNVVVATPRWAGSAWTACSSAVATANYPALTSGSPTAPGHNCPSQYTTPPSFNAVTFGSQGVGSGYYSSNGYYPNWTIRWFLAVGDSGAMYASSLGVQGSNIPNTVTDSNNGSFNSTKGLGNWFQLATNTGSGSCINNNNLRGAAYANSTFVVVGDNGTICFSGPSSSQATSTTQVLAYADNPDAANWFVPDSYYPTYGGAQVISTTGYSGVTINSLNLSQINFRAIATNQTVWNGGANFIAVGRGAASGNQATILYSGDGRNWYNTAMSTALGASGSVTYGTTGYGFSLTPPTNNLNAVTYNSCGYYATTSNGVPEAWPWIAVGDNGTMMFSTDSTGYTGWYTAASNGLVSIPSTSSSLRGIACSPNTTPGYGAFGASTTIPVWVVVGDGGLVWISYDGLTWAVPSSTATHNSYTNFTFPGFSVDGQARTTFPESMTSITHGTRFVATGTSGKIYVSVDGLTWNSTGGTIPKNPICVGSTSDPYCLASTPSAVNSTNTALDTATYTNGSGVSGVSGALNAIAHVPGSYAGGQGTYGYVPFGYIAVGAGGAVTFSQ